MTGGQQKIIFSSTRFSFLVRNIWKELLDNSLGYICKIYLQSDKNDKKQSKKKNNNKKQRGTLGGVEHRNTAEDIDKYPNTAKKSANIAIPHQKPMKYRNRKKLV